VSTLDGDFEVFGASPQFLTDWRWYKAIGTSGRYNELAIDAYWANVHNLLDYRHLSSPRDPLDNKRLYDACVTVRGAVQQYERDRDRRVLTVILPGLEEILTIVRAFSVETSDALAELKDVLARPLLDEGEVAASRRFGPWFGRGQQYLSFSRQAGREGKSHS